MDKFTAIISFMIGYILIVLIGLAVYTAYRFYVVPKRMMKNYAATMRKLGYKVFEYPFRFMSSAYGEILAHDYVTHKDIGWSFKNTLVGYDAVVGNTLDKVNIFFIHPNLIKELMSLEKEYLYTKESIPAKMYEYIMGEGLLFSENKVWKDHRRLISTVFNFDFIKGHVPAMARIADKMFKRCEQSPDSKIIDEKTV